MHYVTFISYICHFATLFCVSAQFRSSNDNNIIHLLPAYAIASRASLLDSATCATELRAFLDAVDQRILWGLKTLDSSGELIPGFLYGNNFWLGSRSQCLDIMNKAPLELAKQYILNNTRYRDPQDEFPPFQLNYFVAYIRHNSTFQYHINTVIEDLITLGLCLPASCSTNNISFILEGIFRDRILLINDLYFVDFNLIQIKNLKDNHQWLLNGAIPFICVGLVLTFALMISGTIYDIFIYQTYLKATNKTVSKYISCLVWSWYLSSDMQFFIIGLALLILSTVYFYVAVVILCTILIASIILSGYISYIYEYVPTLDEQYRLLDVLYFPPWIRIGPYIIGMITGYIIRRFNKKIILKKVKYTIFIFT
ncbi:Nose resistant to fluoxetine protein 6 [Acromyrmex echinatior]|uniref:Nose resistant to fluoxetine protein 6 n=1 Tax=Acromyrmex echinatior TaxID=103372 RepID=F4WN20_ACREC|nr:Nose resistant to fluoxetine protein 6 [Acromyrmex echinatior]